MAGCRCQNHLFLSGCILPCQDVLFIIRMYYSSSGCIIHHQDVLFLIRMFYSSSGCIVPCQDVLFPLRMDYCHKTFFVRMLSAVSITQYHDLYYPVLSLEEFVLFRIFIDYQDVIFPVRMYLSISDCTIPFQDAFFPVRILRSLLLPVRMYSAS